MSVTISPVLLLPVSDKKLNMEKIYLGNDVYDIGLSEGSFFAQPSEGNHISGSTLEELAESLASLHHFSCEEILDAIMDTF